MLDRLVVCLLLHAGWATGYDLLINKKEQLICTGGASYTELGPTNVKGMPGLRSGDPGAPSMCRLKDPVPVPITSVQLTFQYVVGYTPPKGVVKEGPTVAIWAEDVQGSVATDTGGGPVYQSPELPPGDEQKYSFDHCAEKDKSLCYSPNIAVNAECESCTGRYVAFKFENKERNLQILLPITLHIDELDWGLPFVLGFLAILALYAGGGIAYGKRQGGSAAASHKGVDAWKVHPHARRAEELGGLVMDGYVFARVTLSGKAKGGYEPVERQARRSSKAGGGPGGDLDLESGGGGGGKSREKRRSSHMSTSSRSSNKSPKASSGGGKSSKSSGSGKDKKEKKGSSSEKAQKRNRNKEKRKEKKARGEKLTQEEVLEEKEEEIEEEKERQLQELADSTGVHSSQAKIKVIGLNG